MRIFEGRRAIVTGAGTGVGAAIALALAQVGADIHLIGRRPDKLELVADQVRRLGSRPACYSSDLGAESAQLELIGQLIRDLPRLDILVLNAAMYSAGCIEQASLAAFDRLYRTNVRAPYALTQALVPMLKASRGQVVFVNSSSGMVARPKSAQYDSSKHALKAIADSLRSEVNAYGVRVLSVYLGRTASEMQEQIHRMEGRAYQPESLLQPESVASAIMNALTLPPTAEVTDIHIRPMIKS